MASVEAVIPLRQPTFVDRPDLVSLPTRVKTKLKELPAQIKARTKEQVLQAGTNMLLLAAPPILEWIGKYDETKGYERRTRFAELADRELEKRGMTTEDLLQKIIPAEHHDHLGNLFDWIDNMSRVSKLGTVIAFAPTQIRKIRSLRKK